MTDDRRPPTAEQITIRLLAYADVADIASWVAATPLWQRYGVTEESMSKRLRDGIAEGAKIFVAERADDVVGFIWLVERGAFSRSGYVQLIGVRPGERGHGVGRALMAFAEQNVFAQHCDLFLLVSDFNIDAQRFYQRLGYRESGKLEDYVVQGVNELIYWKQHGVVSNK
ncbi:MAG: GNAT family N-acetyltransferase [Chloroflexi bacterium]|nr:GNAT family N-acetyltransferase [Chloroflexota bacterium]